MQDARSVQLQGLPESASHRCRYVRVARGDSRAWRQTYLVPYMCRESGRMDGGDAFFSAVIHERSVALGVWEE